MANILGDNYYNTMDKQYQMNSANNASSSVSPNAPSSSVGITVFEGVDGRFPQAIGTKIKMGADAVELQLSQDDFSKGLGAESYGEEARQDIKDLAEFNDVKIHSVHISHMPNMSGLGKEGFSEQTRAEILNEIGKEIDFAGDVTKGGSVVVHTGEFPRPLAGRFQGFEAYPGEKEEAIISLADKETGNMKLQMRSDQEHTVVEAAIDPKTGRLKRDDDGNVIPAWTLRTGIDRAPKPEDFKPKKILNYEEEIRNNEERFGNPIDARKEFIINHKLTDSGLKEDQLLKLDDKELSGMAFYSDFRSSQLFEAKASIERGKAEADHYRVLAMRAERELERARQKDSSELEIQEIQQTIDAYHGQAKAYMDMAAGGSRQQADIIKDIRTTVPIREVALKRTTDTLAQAGLMAMQTTVEKRLPEPLYMAPENIFPSDYGGHPDEMIEMIEKSRGRMVEMLTKKTIKDPKGRIIDSPYYDPNLNQQQAKELATRHIKASLDTQHLGMWKRHFQKNPGETEEQREERFNRWYMEQVNKLADKGILGNVHVVDGIGRGHSHLPIGQGTYPVAEAIEKLRAKGFTGPMSSEGHGEGAERQMTSLWALTGKSVYAAERQPLRWDQVEGSYLGGVQPPGYIVGDFAKKISPDFTLWSGVPFE